MLYKISTYIHGNNSHTSQTQLFRINISLDARTCTLFDIELGRTKLVLLHGLFECCIRQQHLELTFRLLLIKSCCRRTTPRLTRVHCSLETRNKYVNNDRLKSLVLILSPAIRNELLLLMNERSKLIL